MSRVLCAILQGAESAVASDSARNSGACLSHMSCAILWRMSQDATTGVVRCETKHHMGRRCNDWDYRRRAIYLVTLVLADRSRPILGRLDQRNGKWTVKPSALGDAVLDCWRDIASQWPGVEPLECQLMPEHFHGLVYVKAPQQKPLGAIIGSFKAKTTRWYRDASVTAQNPALDGAATRGATGSVVLRGGALGPAGSAASRSRDALPSLWAKGYVDSILWRRGQLRRMVDYMADNPRRLAEKRAHPDLFKVLRSMAVDLGDDPTWHGPKVGWFAAIGNHNLLARPRLYQVQCSRSYFEYRRERLAGGSWRILRDVAGEPLVAKIDYKGARLSNVDLLAAIAVNSPK